jgi:uncharacterized protein with NRDE domain
MCTLIVLYKVWNDSIIVAANRDERFNRPSKDWYRWDNGMLAPQDAIRGGTWIGVYNDAFKEEKGRKLPAIAVMDITAGG